MRLASIVVQNYLSFGPPCEIQFDECAALIGQNNSGKSNLIRAVELLCEGKTTGLGRESFHRENADAPIEVTGVFTDLTGYERERLAAWLDGAELKLVRRFLLQQHDDGGSGAEDKVESQIACTLRQPRDEWLDDARINKEVMTVKAAELGHLVVGPHLFRERLENPSKPTVKAWKAAAKWFRENCPEDIEWTTEEVPNPQGLKQVLQHNLPEVIRIA
ncbi:MAG: AAA family ATPase, partial [Proteobacteria bacterium]|nr:AAA family ATPase [Pseudomonadota bacterium]